MVDGAHQEDVGMLKGPTESKFVSSPVREGLCYQHTLQNSMPESLLDASVSSVIKMTAIPPHLCCAPPYLWPEDGP
ncbi:hypothetical protein N7456_012554 [Penicillium angulare]|uniref:Uncharacterized protein n=1 Tax=Penicillium angulare TaxID=116970 RepID=A0A9W9EJU1_9EURO|nr:hypothetical protein N7456_012554 [Penicillium angulare]